MWGIRLFAEKKRKGSDTWEMIGSHEILPDVKHILVSNTSDDISYDVDLDNDTFDPVDTGELSKGVTDFYDGNLDEYYMVKSYPIDAMHDLCAKFIDKFQNTAMMCYKALGIRADREGYGYRMLDLDSEDNSKYSNGEPVPNYNQLTYPVNKELLDQLNEESHRYYKAIWWKGVLATIKSLAEEDYKADMDAEIRLIFVRSV